MRGAYEALKTWITKYLTGKIDKKTLMQKWKDWQDGREV